VADQVNRDIGPTALANGNNTVFTGTAGHRYAFRTLYFSNKAGATTRSIKGYLGSVADGNLLFGPSSIAVNAQLAITLLLPIIGAEVLIVAVNGTGVTMWGSDLDSS
jgi:hypothetical protein